MSLLAVALPLLASVAAAAEPALTVSYRALAGLSARYEAPVAPDVVALVEVGGSGWIVPGDDPTGDGGGAVFLARPHVRVGADFEGALGALFLGPRLVFARDEALGAGASSWEGAVQLAVGTKRTSERGTRTHLGAGLGLHALLRDGDGEVLVVPLPFVELRFGSVTRATPG